MSLYRVPLMLLSVGSMHSALTNPNPAVSKEEKIKYSTAKDIPHNGIVLLPPVFKFTYWAAGICESAVILSSHFPDSVLSDRLLSSLVLKPASSISTITVTPAFLAGCFLTVFGSYVRVQCFKTLGKLFTYELSIRPEHKLVTSGPYSVVRHPSYTCAYIAYVGINLCLFGPGSWLKECGWLDVAAGKALLGTVLAFGTVGPVLLGWRTTVEDRTLKAEFGPEWDDWASRVPYRLIPYVF